MKDFQRKCMGLEFLDRLAAVTTKNELFEVLFQAVDKDTKLSTLNLNKLPTSVSMAAFKAARRMSGHKEELLNIMRKINANKKSPFDSVLVNKLNYLQPSAEDYIHIAMDKYFKSKMGRDFHDFTEDWEEFRTDENHLHTPLYNIACELPDIRLNA